MKEKETIIAKIKENKKERIHDANIDGEINNKNNFLKLIIVFLIVLAIWFIYKIVNLIF